MRELLTERIVDTIKIEQFELANIAGVPMLDFNVNEEGTKYQYKLIYNMSAELYIFAKINVATGHKEVVVDSSYIEVLCKLNDKALFEKYKNALSMQVQGKLN